LFEKGTVEGSAAAIYTQSDNIEFTRSWSERSLIELSIFISALLVFVMLILGFQGKISQVFVVYLSLVVLDLGIFQSLSNLWVIAGTALAMIIEDLAIATGLVLAFSLTLKIRPLRGRVERWMRLVFVSLSFLMVLFIKIGLLNDWPFILNCLQEQVIMLFMIIVLIMISITSGIQLWSRSSKVLRKRRPKRSENRSLYE
jgi:hypothetical protein